MEEPERSDGAAGRRRVGGYEILSELHSGGMGSVLLARKRGEHGFEKVVAIKTIRSDLQSRQELRTMFMDEARLVASLNHPAIAQVYDFGQDGDLLYLVMEYVPGISFRQLVVDSGGPLPPEVALRAMAEVCRGLHAAHVLTDQEGRPLGVVHRDVSPHNLMITFSGAVKIIDFGIARVRYRESPTTAVGIIKGKPGYMAPEQIKNEEVDCRTDVFLAGTVLHELLTGRPLFPNDSFAAFTYAVTQEAIAPPSKTRAELTAEVDAVVMRALAREPAERYPTALAMAQALEAAAAAHGTSTLAAFVEQDLIQHALVHRERLKVLLDDEEIVETLAFDRREGRTASLGPDPSLTTAASTGEAQLLTPHTPPTAVVGPWRRAGGRRPEDVRASGSLPPAALDSRPRRASTRTWLLLGTLIAVTSAVAALSVRRLATLPHVAPPMSASPEPRPTPPAAPTVKRDPEPAPDASPAPEAAPPAAVEKSTKHGPTHGRQNHIDVAATPRPSPEAATPPETQQVGQLTVGAKPYAYVRIDNEEIGATPLIDYRLSVGQHTVELLDPRNRGVLLSRDIWIVADEHESITLP